MQRQASSQEQLHKLIMAANAGALTAEQLSQLRTFLNSTPQNQALAGLLQPNVGSTNGGNAAGGGGGQPRSPAPQQQPHPQQPQQQFSAAGNNAHSIPVQVQMQNENSSQGQPQQVPPSQPQQPQQRGSDPAEVIRSLQMRISQVETILKRTDLTDHDRNRLTVDRDNSKRTLDAIIQRVGQLHQQGQAQQQQGSGSANAGGSDLQLAQQRAMAQKAQQLQAQLQSGANGNSQQGAGNPNAPTGLTLPPAPQGAVNMRRSPHLGPQQMPNNVQAKQLPAQQLAQGASAAPSPARSNAGSPAPPASDSAPHMPPRKRQPTAQQLQAAAAISARPSTPQQQGGGSQASSSQGGPPQTTGSSTPAPTVQPAIPFTIPDSMPMPTYKPESFPSGRPTLSSGLANNPIVSTPAITKPPLANLPGQPNSTTAGDGTPDGANGGAGGSTSAAPGMAGSNSADGSTGAVTAADGGAAVASTSSISRPDVPSLSAPGPLALKNTEGPPYNKRKLQDLLHSIDPEQVLDNQVEDLLLEIADEFVDTITRAACRLAKHRRSDRLECKDLNFVLDKSFNMHIPGFGSDEIKSSALAVGGPRRQNLPNYQSRLNAVRDAKVVRQAK